MQERTLRVLEFYKIRQMLASYAVSEMGKERCLSLVPGKGLADAQGMLAQTEEAAVYLTRSASHPMSAFEDIRPQLQKARIGSVLSQRELLQCAACLRVARSVQRALLRPEQAQSEQLASLSALAQELVCLRDVEEAITSAVLSDTEMADNASPELASVRRHIRVANEKIREKLNAYLHNPAMLKYLQEPVITVRQGRYVLPVKQEYRQQVAGLIHDQSGTGSTLFIEPMAVVELGNELRRLSAAEGAEIEKILAALTAQLAPYVQELLRDLEILAHLDFVFAKGALARAMRAAAPTLNAHGRIRIKRGRHPLIDGGAVVPINLWVGQDFSTLVVTGPNTGGKTVTLKTVGLFSLMAQAGLHVPADAGTELSVFDEIFADIGDEQSIEQSLSTFSSHMTNIVSILAHVTPRSLVLFDELGAGTDPTEGASLAQSILETLRKQKVITLATTHYSELKAYAMTTPGVCNASVEFNVETLRPTYKLFIGIPGKSNAFEISKRLGLSEEIIEDARTRLTTDQIRFEDVISNAEYHRQVAQKERELAEEARKEIVRLQEEIERQQAKLEEQKKTLMERARREARQVVYRAKQEAEQIIADLKKTASEQSAITRQSQQARQKLERSLSENAEGLPQVQQSVLAQQPPKTLRPGDEVQVVSLGVKAQVLSVPNGKGEVQVQAGAMKFLAELKNLRLVSAAQLAQEKKKGGSVTRSIDMQGRYVPLELDVRGQTLDEAIESVERYLDDAYLASRTEVSIIHGKGTGALRTGLQNHLRRHPAVKSMRDGKYGEGDAGVTVLTLR